MWGIPIYITFMILLVGFVFLMCHISARKEKDADTKNIKAKQNGIEKSLNKNDGPSVHKKQSGSYKKLFQNVVIDDDDENIDDIYKLIDDMMFMDLMDEDWFTKINYVILNEDFNEGVIKVEKIDAMRTIWVV